MENGLNFDTFLASLPFGEKQLKILKNFYHNYKKAGLSNGHDEETIRHNFAALAKFVADEVNTPSTFEPYHEAVFSPSDYYQFGIDFMNVLVEHPVKIMGQDHLENIARTLKAGHNVVLFANHQTEPDPQLISIALMHKYPDIAKNMIFVAGERVITDPLAIPFSKGRNLLCIYSKRYIDHPPELKLQKQLHNKKTMEKMSELLKEGGKIIYVAPSGGRDRKNPNGDIQVAPFDPQSLEMFILMARKAKTKTVFHTLALSTYYLMPPPEGIQIELGEDRLCNKTKIGFYFGAAIDLEKYNDLGDKHIQREKRAQDLTLEVNDHFHALL